jgi:hypothetical protein
MPFRVHLDSKWNAAEFAAFFSATNELYQYYAISLAPDPWERGPFAYYPSRRAFSLPNLKVEKISFASPGFTDLAGVAAAIRELREFMQFVITHVSTREDRGIERESKRIELAQKRVDLLRAAATLESDFPERFELSARLFGINQPGIPNIDPIIEAISEQRVTRIEKLDDGSLE